eukprot:2797462-Pyramimonas_sp.AAC.1
MLWRLTEHLAELCSRTTLTPSGHPPDPLQTLSRPPPVRSALGGVKWPQGLGFQSYVEKYTTGGWHIGRVHAGAILGTLVYIGNGILRVPAWYTESLIWYATWYTNGLLTERLAELVLAALRAGELARE